jgi:two-component system response regulator PilR (NtrC family)
MNARANILVAEDERSMREFLEILLGRHDYHVVSAANGAEALQLIEKTEFDLVLTDLKMPKVGGLELLRESKRRCPATEVVVVTAFATTETAIEAMKVGAYDYLTKPFKVDEILVTVERALEKRSLVRDNAALREQLSGRYELEQLVGRSAPMQHVFEVVRRVAPTISSVLITGESGTGKELVARAIHALSARKAKAFVPVNCGAIPEALMESELFGHARGAFTGADSRKEGLFEAADGGTLFLDEIGELSPGLQVKLLRTLQEKAIKRVGDVSERRVDVRILAASNRDLEAEIGAGRFRSDLFYRLNVIPLHLPALRERPEDIPLLVERFIAKISVARGRRPPRMTPQALALLCRYRYPGNVRELENLIERAVTLTPNDQIDASALPELNNGSSAKPEGPQLDILPDEGLDLDQHIGAIERALLLQALDRSEGGRTKAAKLLGLSLRSLRYRLAKFGIGD